MRTNTIIQQRLDDDRTNDKKKPKTSREYPAMNIPVLLKKKTFCRYILYFRGNIFFAATFHFSPLIKLNCTLPFLLLVILLNCVPYIVVSSWVFLCIKMCRCSNPSLFKFCNEFGLLVIVLIESAVCKLLNNVNANWRVSIYVQKSSFPVRAVLLLFVFWL